MSKDRRRKQFGTIHVTDGSSAPERPDYSFAEDVCSALEWLLTAMRQYTSTLKTSEMSVRPNQHLTSTQASTRRVNALNLNCQIMVHFGNDEAEIRIIPLNQVPNYLCKDTGVHIPTGTQLDIILNDITGELLARNGPVRQIQSIQLRGLQMKDFLRLIFQSVGKELKYEQIARCFHWIEHTNSPNKINVCKQRLVESIPLLREKIRTTRARSYRIESVGWSFCWIRCADVDSKIQSGSAPSENQKR